MRSPRIRLQNLSSEGLEQANGGRWKWDAGATAVAAIALLAGCSGVIGTTNDGQSSGGSGDTGGLLGGRGGTPSTYRPAPATLRRLTVAQYQNSVRDLLGQSITTPTDLEPDTVISGFASIAAARVAVSAHATEQFETAALALAHQALTDATLRSSLVKCTPTGPSDAACATQFVNTIGRRAWRRPLTGEETSRYVGIAISAGGKLTDFYVGLEYALAGLLQSPHFLYREELGTPDAADASRRVFQGYELATRLSYFLWNSTPDDALLDAAGAGKLSTDAGLRAEAERLLASPRAHEATQSYFTELLQLATLDDLPQLPAVFPQMSGTLGESMRNETLRVLDDVAMNSNGDFRQIFETRTTFVNAELAKLYGIPAPGGSGFVKTTLPDSGARGGLLGQGSFLALTAHAESSSPTRRGKFIREVLLCQAIPPPPPNVDTKLPPDMPGTQRTMRQKLDIHRQVAACATCHVAMDPIGLGLENFDGIGAFRTTEVGQTIDASGDLDGVHFQDARSLGTVLKNHPDIGSCAARSIFRYATGHVEVDSEEILIEALSSKLSTDGYQFRSLLLALVGSAGFRYGGNLD